MHVQRKVLHHDKILAALHHFSLISRFSTLPRKLIYFIISTAHNLRVVKSANICAFVTPLSPFITGDDDFLMLCQFNFDFV